MWRRWFRLLRVWQVALKPCACCCCESGDVGARVGGAAPLDSLALELAVCAAVAELAVMFFLFAVLVCGELRH